MNIPLEKRLKKRMHSELAFLQDEVLEMLYSIDNRLVLHGGTAVWRCYRGNRFSEDLDMYSTSVAQVKEKLPQLAKVHSIQVNKLKTTENLLFAKLSAQGTEVRVEINYSAKILPCFKSYEKADGSYMEILTLPAEDLIIEKINAYQSRKFVRDIYDIYHLSNYVAEPEKIKEVMLKFLQDIKPPIDEKNLKTLVYTGAVPSFSSIIESLKRRYR